MKLRLFWTNIDSRDTLIIHNIRIIGSEMLSAIDNEMFN